MERLSIIIVHRNRIHYLKVALDSILRNTIHPFELLIYDNASDYPDRRFLRRLEKEAKVPVKVFYGEENIGVWKASNILLANASSRTTLGVIKCDNDVIVRTKGWESKWMKVAQDISQVGVIGANAEQVSRKNSHITPLTARSHNLLVNTDYGTGVCVFLTPWFCNNLGYYEECFGSMGHGDKSLEVRCRSMSKWFVYDEDVRVDREKPGRRDYYGGYRQWKNQYVKNNRPVFEKFKEEYLSGKRSPAVWYDKYPHPEGVQLSDPKSLVNWESGIPL
jgi:glycosyltransferase involved in cell wall biosynthesis